ncbi:hypothetical protein H0G86_006182 [Trichoderma simmonsii]|uniref:Uncharacterized protein n=1 Tax=Trichoderma simmonsii TaxID=1491479 RepID=A0A8G0PJN3_9HYPO|nr:hypothetical protein H0G86_006182 [Trichoderma simmonsii]
MTDDFRNRSLTAIQCGGTLADRRVPVRYADLHAHHLCQTAKTAPNEGLAELDMHPRPFGSRLRINLSVDPLAYFSRKPNFHPYARAQSHGPNSNKKLVVSRTWRRPKENGIPAWLPRERRFQYRVRHGRVHIAS